MISYIVGYKTTEAEGSYAYTQLCPVFDTVNQANVIRFADLNLENIDRNDTIQVFGEDGEIKHMLTCKRRGTSGNYEYYWQLADYSVDPDNPTITDEIDQTTYTFPRGAGFWFCPKKDSSITMSGAVNTNDVVYATEGGYMYTQAGNPFPVAKKLAELEFGDIDRNDTIQVFGVDGEIMHMLTCKRRGTSGNYEYYWQLADYSVDPDDPAITDEVNKETYTFPSGSAFWLCLKKAQTITIKGINL